MSSESLQNMSETRVFPAIQLNSVDAGIWLGPPNCYCVCAGLPIQPDEIDVPFTDGAEFPRMKKGYIFTAGTCLRR